MGMTIEEAIKHGQEQLEIFGGTHGEFIKLAIKALEQEPQTFKWCSDCREYDQENHCCHRWSKVIRDTVEEMKQEYIERDVLDKIREEIDLKYGHCVICEYSSDYYGSSYVPIGDITDVLQIISKHKAETEEI